MHKNFGFAPAPEPAAGCPGVYMTTFISPDGLMKAYQALGRAPKGNVAVKLSPGEPGNNCLRAVLRVIPRSISGQGAEPQATKRDISAVATNG